MVLEPIYLDLSSSDDDDDDHNRAGSTALMYLSKVFHMDADDDDVMILDKPTSIARVRRDRPRVIRSALDDDECCILDMDPGAGAAPDIISSLDTDELVMTGEKGPVACRDFPHARYLCVHFPFKTTLHSKFCAQCHCYVCDSLAPCSLWGEGNDPNDHCHASEEPRWKTLRKVAKCGTVPSLAFDAADTTGGSRLLQPSFLQQTMMTPPGTRSLVGTLVGSGVPRPSQPRVKRDPLVINLKGKARGKPSQPPHLGVRSSHPHKILPVSSLPRHRNRPPPRSTSTPSGRLEEVVPAVSIATQSTQPTNPNPGLGSLHHPILNPDPPRSASTPSGRSEVVEFPVSAAAQSPQPTTPNCGLVGPGGRGTVAAAPPHPRSMPCLNPLPGNGGASTTDMFANITSPPGVQLPQSTLNSNAAPDSLTVFPPVTNTPSSHTSLPPPVENNVSVLRPPGAAEAVPDFVSPTPPAPASACRHQEDSDVNMDLSTSSQPQAVNNPRIGVDYVAQGFITSPANSAQNASSSHPVDIQAEPIEGWEMDAAVEFDAFTVGISDLGTSLEQMTTSLNDVVQQMADILGESRMSGYAWSTLRRKEANEPSSFPSG